MKAGDIIGTNQLLELDIEKTSQMKRNNSYWKVKCLMCDKVRTVRDDGLNRKCRSCAAKSRTDNKTTAIQDNLTGKTFGFWVVLEKANKQNYWKCQCKNCGTVKDVFRGNLTQGNSKSCGCVNSWGEIQIAYILNENNIKYIKEYTFQELKTNKGGTPRFDFAIFKNNTLFCIIEYDGRQHYAFDDNWKMSKEEYDRLQFLDVIKTEYCQSNNIPLYRLNQNSDLNKEIKEIIKEIKGD